MERKVIGDVDVHPLLAIFVVVSQAIFILALFISSKQQNNVFS
jgi:hypothetical protein